MYIDRIPKNGHNPKLLTKEIMKNLHRLEQIGGNPVINIAPIIDLPSTADIRAICEFRNPGGSTQRSCNR